MLVSHLGMAILLQYPRCVTLPYSIMLTDKHSENYPWFIFKVHNTEKLHNSMNLK